MEKNVSAAASSTSDASLGAFGGYNECMWDMVRRMVWFAVVSTAASFAVFAVLGNFAIAGAENEGPVVIRDVLSPGAHQFSGMLLLPLACDELSVQSRPMSSSTYQIIFQTWQDPSIACPPGPTPREFKTVIFAPSVGVEFLATLDGKSFPIEVVPDIPAPTSTRP
jgi:hypothetical protein